MDAFDAFDAALFAPPPKVPALRSEKSSGDIGGGGVVAAGGGGGVALPGGGFGTPMNSFVLDHQLPHEETPTGKVAMGKRVRRRGGGVIDGGGAEPVDDVAVPFVKMGQRGRSEAKPGVAALEPRFSKRPRWCVVSPMCR